MWFAIKICRTSFQLAAKYPRRSRAWERLTRSDIGVCERWSGAASTASTPLLEGKGCFSGSCILLGFGPVQMMPAQGAGSARLEFPASGCRWDLTAPLAWVIELIGARAANDAGLAALRFASVGATALARALPFRIVPEPQKPPLVPETIAKPGRF
jgi:hypothetical protein